MTILIGWQGDGCAIFGTDRLAHDRCFGNHDIDKIYKNEDGWLIAMTGTKTERTWDNLCKHGKKLKKSYAYWTKKEGKIKGIMVADTQKCQLYAAHPSSRKLSKVISFLGRHSLDSVVLEPGEVTISGYVTGSTKKAHFQELNQFYSMIQNLQDPLDIANVTEEFIEIMSNKFPEYIGGSEIYIINSKEVYLHSKKNPKKSQETGLARLL